MTDTRTEWLKWRQQGIGSSDAPAIHCASPYVTPYELWEQKTGSVVTEKQANFAMNKGNEYEPIARSRFAADFNIENGSDEDFAPRNVTLANLPFMRASLDGCSKDGKTIIEIKYQGKKNHESKEIRDDYMIQMQHQLLVSQADICYFISFDGVTLWSRPVSPDQAFFSKHIKACTDFWYLVQERKSPVLTDEDYKEIKTGEAKDLALLYKTQKSALDQITKEIEETKEKLVALSDHPRVICDGLRIFKMKGNRGSVDYAKVMTDPRILALGIDLESYRKPDGKPFSKIEIIK